MVSNLSKYAVMALVAILILGAFAAIVLTGEPEAYDGPVDAAGNRISFSAVPMSIVSTAPSLTETLITMGYAEKIIGASNNCDAEVINAMESDGKITRVGSYNNPSQEEISNCSADVIFIADYNQNTLATYNVLKSMELKVVLLYGGDSLTEVYLNIRIIGQVMNDLTNAENHEQNMIEMFNEVKTRSAEATVKPKVMINLGYDYGFSSVYGAGTKTFGHDMILMSNSTNVLAKASGWSKVTPELLQVSATNPQVILIMVQDGTIANSEYYNDTLANLRVDDKWKDTDAVLNGAVYLFAESATNVGQRASPNLVYFSQLVLIYTHPELFNISTLPTIIGNNYVDFINEVW